MSTPMGCAGCACRRSAPTTSTGSCIPHRTAAPPSSRCSWQGCRCRTPSRWTSAPTGPGRPHDRPNGPRGAMPPWPGPSTIYGSVHQPYSANKPCSDCLASSPARTQHGSPAGISATTPLSGAWRMPMPPSTTTALPGGAGSAGCCGWRWPSATPTVTTWSARKPSTTCPTSSTRWPRSCGARVCSAPAPPTVEPAPPPSREAAGTAAHGASGHSARAAATGASSTPAAPAAAAAELGCRSATATATGCAAAAACTSPSTARRR